MQKIFVFFLVALGAFACTPNNVKISSAIGKQIDSAGMQGSFALMENSTEANFKTVLKGLKRAAWWSGIRQIQFHCSPGTKLYQLFAKHFTESPSYPVLFQDFGSSIPPEKIKFTFSDIDIF